VFTGSQVLSSTYSPMFRLFSWFSDMVR